MLRDPDLAQFLPPPRLVVALNASVEQSKTDAFVVNAMDGDERAVVERLRTGQVIDAVHAGLDLAALHGAVDAGQFQVVGTLIAAGANVNVRRKVRRCSVLASWHFCSSLIWR